MRAAFTAVGLLCQLAVAMAAMAAEPVPLQAISGTPALTLSQAWRLAVERDPGYRAAISEREAGQANRALGRAGLLPQVNASLGRTKIHGTLETPGACGPTCTDLDYMSRINEIRATQTVFDWGRIAEYRQGQARADQSLAVFDVKAEETSIRLVNRYFQALLTHENVELARAKLAANDKQVEAAEHRFEGGDGTIPEVREALSRRDLARADLIKAEDARIVALRELQEMIGDAPAGLTALRRNFRPQPPVPHTEADWLAIAMADNPAIRAAEQEVRVSGHDVDRTFGGHLPTLELVAARRNVDAETISTRDQSSNTTAIGIELSLSLYSGGRVSAQVQQARHNRERAVQELAATREQVAVEVARQYQAVMTGAQRIAALELAVRSSEEALKATEMGYQLGTRTILDVLDAEDQVFRSKLDLTETRLQYALAHLSLAAAAGHLDGETIQRVDDTYFGQEQVALR